MPILQLVTLTLVGKGNADLGISCFVADRQTRPEGYPPAATPDSLGLAYELLEFESAEDGLTLRGWWMQSPDNDRAVILVQGRNSNRSGINHVWDTDMVHSFMLAWAIDFFMLLAVALIAVVLIFGTTVLGFLSPAGPAAGVSRVVLQIFHELLIGGPTSWSSSYCTDTFQAPRWRGVIPGLVRLSALCFSRWLE